LLRFATVSTSGLSLAKTSYKVEVKILYFCDIFGDFGGIFTVHAHKWLLWSCGQNSDTVIW